MSENKNTLRSPLGIARGLGSAKSGTEHWVAERVSALLMIPVTFYLLIGFLNNVVLGGYSGAMYWMQSPLTATFVILFFLAGLKHWAAGVQVVMEDYIPRELYRLPLLYVVKFVGATMAIVGTLSVARIFFGV